MRNLILVLIAIFAVVTFIRAYDREDVWVMDDLVQQATVEVLQEN